MLFKTKEVIGYKLQGLDGVFGTVKEFYFDDQLWGVRYLVADTGTWLNDRKVLISPYSLIMVDHTEKAIHVDLTKKQIEDCPALSYDLPVSKQYEETYYSFFGLPLYWSGPYMWGMNSDLVRDREKWNVSLQTSRTWDPHLRSTKDMTGHHIHATDGEIGHAIDFVFDDTSWTVQYFVIDTRVWILGKHVLISPQWIERISWAEKTVYINLTCEVIKNAPTYTPDELLTRSYEERLYKHYNFAAYWSGELATNSDSSI